MANFIAVTASSGAKIKKGKESDVQKLIDEYPCVMEDGQVKIEDGQNGDKLVYVWGYDWLSMRKKDDDDAEGYDWDGMDVSDEFLTKLAKLIKTKLVIHCIGYEKCRFPLGAMAIVVAPNKRPKYHNLPS